MAYPSYPTTISGKIYTVPPTSADSGRYQFINLQNAEPNLGLPALSTNGNTKYSLLSDPIMGTRYWSNNTVAVNGQFVGMGTDTPNQKLTVVGNISATGTIYANTISFSGIQVAAAGKNTFVQYNSNGSLSGDGGFTYLQAYSSVVIGVNNTTVGGSILGGASNSINNLYGGIVGGTQNAINNQYGFIGGGYSNSINGDYAVVAGGSQNNAAGTYSVIGGGASNRETGLYNFIGSGNNNVITQGNYSVIVGGYDNTVASAIAQYATIVGGQMNTASQANTFILGSYINTISANYTYVNNISSQNMITGQFVSVGTNSTANAVTVVGNISATGNIYGNLVTPPSAQAGGVTGNIQYNNNGSFAGDAGLTYNSSISTVFAPKATVGSISFTALSALSATIFNSTTATGEFLTINVGSSSLAIQLYRYF